MVQGVFFRYSARSEALELGLTGWVINRRDGKVEILAEGEEGAIDKFVKWCRKGPPGALVEDLDVSWENPSGEFSSFSIR